MEAPLRQRIDAARSLGDRPHRRRLTACDGIDRLLRERAAAAPGRPFLVSFDEHGQRQAWTYGQFLVRVQRTAAWLAGCGLVPGDRVVVLSDNRAETVVQYFAAWTAGLVVVPANPGEDDARLAYILEHSGARLAFVRDRFCGRLEAMADRLPALEFRVVCGDARPGWLPFAQALGPQGPPAPPIDRLDDEALIVYTSGTTGAPKGVVLTQYNLLADAEGIAAWHGLKPGARLMCVLPLHHVNGIVVTLLVPLACGGTVVLNHRFQTGTFFARLYAERVAVVSVVPTLLAFLLQADAAGALPPVPPLTAFRHLICGAGPLTIDLAARFEERFGLRIVHGYGLSETTCYSCFLPTDLSAAEHRRWLADHGFPSIGTPIAANEMAIHDPAGRPLPAGERGEIVIRGHNVMQGYFADPAANEAAFSHGWFRSGDEGFFREDAAGRPFFFITGRLKELIIRGGVNISPLAVDEVLAGLPGIRAGVAVGFPNEVYGEEVGAYVVPLPGVTLDAEAVLAACRALLPHAQCPKVVIVGDELPVTSTGKVRRRLLQEHFAPWRTTQFRRPD